MDNYPPGYSSFETDNDERDEKIEVDETDMDDDDL